MGYRLITSVTKHCAVAHAGKRSCLSRLGVPMKLSSRERGFMVSKHLPGKILVLFGQQLPDNHSVAKWLRSCAPGQF